MRIKQTFSTRFISKMKSRKRRSDILKTVRQSELDWAYLKYHGIVDQAGYEEAISDIRREARLK